MSLETWKAQFYPRPAEGAAGANTGDPRPMIEELREALR